jgi:lambda family phage portal protein
MNLSPELIASMRASMTPTRLDRMIATMAPSWGLKRMQARAIMAVGGAFSGALRGTQEMANWNPLLQSQDDETPWWDRATLVSRSADLEKNDPVGGGIISELTTSVIGTGLSLHLEPRRRILGWSEDQAAEWAQDVQERFGLWAENPNECDLTRKRNFYQGQAVAYLTVATRGDAFAILPSIKHPGGIWSTKVQLLEGDRCLTPSGTAETETLRQGIETDAYGAPKRYHFAKKHPRGLWQLKPEDFMPPIDAFDARGRRQVLHLMHEKRMDMRRGIPVLAPVMTTLKQVSRLGEAELMASVVTSMLAVLVKNTGSGAASGGPFGTAQKDSGGNKFTELGYGTVADLAPGEDIVTVAPNRPNGAYDPFFRAIVGQVAMRVQIPPEVLFKKFESSYTAARGALLQFWKFITIEREQFMGSNYCGPIFEMWLAEDVASGRTKAPGYFANPLLRYAYGSARWIGDNPPILDPLKEVLAAQELINYGLSTYEEQTLRLTGGDFDANTDRLQREVAKRKAAGLVAEPPTPKPTIKDGVAEEEPGLEPDDTEREAPPPGEGKAPQKGARRDALLRLALEESQENTAALIKALTAASERQIHIEVQAPPAVVVPPAQVNVNSPAIHLPAPRVEVNLPEFKPSLKTVVLERSSDGEITSATVRETQ